MIDYFALALAHGLLVVAFLRLATREGLDAESETAASAEQVVEPDEIGSKSRRQRGRRRP
ncbi:hypothetical protein AMC99_02375 [Altererythrobacter epoxidivorans]|uniref:Uncharacterized protein n=1 Tax=Altererythrobacter epoxidivorans TaxID=361183 RepID=A0A0M4MXJ2_9SPHN|nr:hypothetical protein [Altererythrobacter epoxidivorans]ALE17650.1 hypothetical protein AMC99_02375 [Altererythrobacter epoxidivorans]